MRPDIGLGEYRAARRGALLATKTVQRRRRDGVAISPIGPDVGDTAVIRSAAA